MSEEFDLFVIGAGSGGVRAARVSASLGARVGIAEERELGGTCVNVGCIPKKLMVYAAHFSGAFEDSRAYGWSRAESRFDWPTFLAAKDREIQRLNGVYARLLDEAGVERIEGHARILDPHTVAVGERRFRTRYLLLATGGWPAVPEIPGAELGITSNEAFHLERMPERVLIVGGGYIAVEFAGIYHGLGAQVTQIYRGPLFLRGFDDDLRTVLAEEMRKRKLDLRFDCDLASIELCSNGLRAKLVEGGTLEVDQVMFATGRRPNTRELGLEDLGVKLDDSGAVAVDAFSCSSVPGIYAIGDLTNRINLTPVAIHEGMCLANTLFGKGATRPDHDGVASAVFSDPPLGSVGLTEAQARDAHGDVDIYRSRFRSLLNTLTGSDETTLMKLIVDPSTGRVLGVHMLGPDAGEVIQGFAVALKGGATKAQLDATIGIHPTAAEELVTMREPS